MAPISSSTVQPDSIETQELRILSPAGVSASLSFLSNNTDAYPSPHIGRCEAKTSDSIQRRWPCGAGGDGLLRVSARVDGRIVVTVIVRALVGRRCIPYSILSTLRAIHLPVTCSLAL